MLVLVVVGVVVMAVVVEDFDDEAENERSIGSRVAGSVVSRKSNRG